LGIIIQIQSQLIWWRQWNSFREQIVNKWKIREVRNQS
jgi:hypothetical protein